MPFLPANRECAESPETSVLKLPAHVQRGRREQSSVNTQGHHPKSRALSFSKWGFILAQLPVHNVPPPLLEASVANGHKEKGRTQPRRSSDWSWAACDRKCLQAAVRLHECKKNNNSMQKEWEATEELGTHLQNILLDSHGLPESTENKNTKAAYKYAMFVMCN